MRIRLVAALAAIAATQLLAETHLTGDLSEVTLTAKGNPYIVEQDIMVPEGKKVVIGEGTVFLFKQFTGMQVRGDLEVNGSTGKPVVFTSVNDADYNRASEQLANPFDWNGILVQRESGSVVLKQFQLYFSVYGIKSQNAGIQIVSGLFKQNGQFHFTVNDKIQYVQDNIPFSYNVGENTANPPVKPPVKPDKPGVSNTRTIVRYGCLGVAAIGTVSAVAFGIAAGSENAYLTKTLEPQFDDYSARNAIPEFQAEWDKHVRARDSRKTAAIVSGILGGLGLGGFVLTFVF